MTETLIKPTTVDTPMPRAALGENVAPKLGYFQQALPINLILFTFALVTIPLALLTVFRPSALLMWTYVWLFGMTHLVVTFTVYLQSRNLRYFTSSTKNVLIYMAIPIVVFLGFDLLHAFRIGALFPTFALLFWGAIRLLDLNHFNRQTFGVFQLFKARAGVSTAPWMKRCENGYFHSLTVMIFATFLNGGTSPFLRAGTWSGFGEMAGSPAEPVLPLGALQIIAGIAAVCALGFFIASMVGFRTASRNAGNKDGLIHALLYFAFQSASALMAVVSFPLYLAALAMHYVEYHVLMVPRCLNSPLDETSRLDRFYGRMRSNRFAFYSIVLAVAFLVTCLSMAGMGMMGRAPESLMQPFDYLVLIAVFDGLFVFHYFIEMFIWRFSDPYYRKSLAGLYFATKK